MEGHRNWVKVTCVTAGRPRRHLMSDAVSFTPCYLESYDHSLIEWPALDSTGCCQNTQPFSPCLRSRLPRDSRWVLLASGLRFPESMYTSRNGIQAALNLGCNCSPGGAYGSVLRKEDTFQVPAKTGSPTASSAGQPPQIREVRSLLSGGKGPVEGEDASQFQAGLKQCPRGQRKGCDSSFCSQSTPQASYPRIPAGLRDMRFKVKDSMFPSSNLLVVQISVQSCESN